ncbi:MAG: MBL fold metallo-hydrolase, partial [Planctomycetes bacterium]|nr:MBL fold metallo-hydrolase [Planctomycetota bacterium]
MAKPRKTPDVPTVTFWGAARTVTGSMHQVEACGQNLLLDCGLFQGRREESRRRNCSFPFRPKDIDAVILSHAHVDHCGNLPHLVKQGFIGPIYCTPATRALAAVMLGDAAKIQMEDAAYLNKKRLRGEPKIEPLYDSKDVFRTLLRLQAVPYDTPLGISAGMQATFVDAGHLLGSAMVSLRMDLPQGERRLTFTGDLGRDSIPILRDPAPVPIGDFLISESTYGGHTHETVEETSEHLGAVVKRTADRGGKLIIPAFSVGRTQSVIYFLHQLMKAGQLPGLPIYVDSPMAVRATEVYKSHPECFDQETLHLMQTYPDLFGGEHVRYVEKVHESIALNDHPGPCIIISASGMCEAGRILHHLKHNVENPRSTILIVGFQAPDTLGRRLVERRPYLRILGREFALKAEVVVLNGLSSHADHPDLLRRLSPLVGTAKKVCLVHGEIDRATPLAEGLRQIGFADVEIPDRGEPVALSTFHPSPTRQQGRAFSLAGASGSDV